MKRRIRKIKRTNTYVEKFLNKYENKFKSEGRKDTLELIASANSAEEQLDNLELDPIKLYKRISSDIRKALVSIREYGEMYWKGPSPENKKNLDIYTELVGVCYEYQIREPSVYRNWIKSAKLIDNKEAKSD